MLKLYLFKKSHHLVSVDTHTLHSHDDDNDSDDDDNDDNNDNNDNDNNDDDDDVKCVRYKSSHGISPIIIF